MTDKKAIVKVEFEVDSSALDEKLKALEDAKGPWGPSKGKDKSSKKDSKQKEAENLTPLQKIEATAKKIAGNWGDISKNIDKSVKGLGAFSKISFGLGATFAGLTGLAVGAVGGFAGAAIKAASHISDLNTRARSLGLKPGQEQAFNNVYGPAGGSSDLLSKIANAKSDPRQWRFLAAAGISAKEIQSQDVPSLAATFLEKAGAQFKERGLMYAESMGLTQFADPETLRRAGSYNREDYQKFGTQYSDAAKRMAVEQGIADKATEFRKAIGTLTDEIKNKLMAALVGLSPEITKLGKTISENLTKYLDSKEFKEGVKGFIKGIGDTIDGLKALDKWLLKDRSEQIKDVKALADQLLKDLQAWDIKASAELVKKTDAFVSSIAKWDENLTNEALKRTNSFITKIDSAIERWQNNSLKSLGDTILKFLKWAFPNMNLPDSAPGSAGTSGGWSERGASGSWGLPTPSKNTDKRLIPVANKDIFFSNTEKKYGLPKGIVGTLEKLETNGGTISKMVSKTGALGPFQFMPETAKEYGLKNPWDESQSAEAAAKYLKKSLSRYNGDVAKALASYNAGSGYVDKLSKKHGKNWRTHLNKETSGYLNKAEANGLNINVIVPDGASAVITDQ